MQFVILFNCLLTAKRPITERAQQRDTNNNKKGIIETEKQKYI